MLLASLLAPLGIHIDVPPPLAGLRMPKRVNESFTKSGPGRRHLRGPGPKWIPREVERSAFHPEVVAERRRIAETLGLF